ncbi:sigma-E processing peptidase SpoIIGA [Cohnella suwonensis]|uniref:Sigma-E processing peptidase SpoIIGA n=1 Tax=Cohnella suwonensis TaxID=696072 RepID=A0ABW0LPD4_9BACL
MTDGGISMTVYIDLVFLNNLAVDASVLLLTAKMRHLHPSRLRLFSSALLGASYAAAMFLAHLPYFFSLSAKVIVSLAMVFIAFGYGGPLRFVRNVGAFYAVSFGTLGGVIGISFLLQSADSPWGGMTVTSGGGIVLTWQLQLGLYAVALLLSIWILRSASETRKKSLELDQLIWDIEIRIDDAKWPVKALLDTGNRLYDPLTRTPVLIMESGVWEDQLPEGWHDRLKNESPDRLLTDATTGSAAVDQWKWAHRIRLVPFRAVNGSSKLMLAIKPDCVLLSREGHPPIQVNRVLVGLDGGTMSSEGTYRAIVHPDVAQAGAEEPAPSQPA